jgi:hypothetical protein
MNLPTMPMPPELESLMASSPAGVSLTGPDGQPAAYVLSQDEYEMMRKAFYDWADAQFTEEDMRRSLANPKRHSMEAVLKLVEGE